MASAPAPAAGNSPHRRESARLRVCIPGQLILLDGTFDCALDDISQGGARVICDAPLAQDDSGVLQCQRLDVFFDVAWAERQAFGLKFAEPVSLGTIRSIRWFNDQYRDQYERELREMVRDWVAGRTD